MSIIAEYSLWFIPLCIVAGFAVAYILYTKDKKLQDAPKNIKRILFALRTLLISILLILLLGPFVERKFQDIKKPVIVVLQDNSASLLLHKDSLTIKKEYLKDLKIFNKKLSDDYEVDIYSFGNTFKNDTSFSFKDKQTDISQAFKELSSRYYNRNLGAIVLATDGIYNVGENPVYTAQNMSVSVPIYTIGLGDTLQSRDNVIANVLHNSIAFKNNPFTVRLEIESHMLKDKVSKIELYDGNKKVYDNKIVSNKQKYYPTIDCKLSSSDIGQKLYTAKIQRQIAEVSYKNNEFTFSVEVLESRQKVLLLYSGVHPDVGAIKRSLQNNTNFIVTTSSVSNFKGDVSDYNCIIAHGFPRIYGPDKEIMQKIMKSNVPILYVYNNTMHLPLLETLQLGIEISSRGTSVDEVQARCNKDFSLFEITNEMQTFIETAPPLHVPYGDYGIQAITSVICWQNIGGVETNKPLIVCNELQGVKRAFICGEGLWRWQIHDYRKNRSTNQFDSFINKIVGYLALTQKRSLFSVQSKKIFSDNQEVEFTSELYYKNYEPAVNKEIHLEIKDRKGKVYPYVFSPNGDFYKLQAGKFASGEYSYTAQVEVDKEKLTQKGKFYVIPLHVEYTQTQANHRILEALSSNSGGTLYYPNQFDSLYNAIKENQNIVSVSHYTDKRTSLIDSMVILIILICIACSEWFFRKFYGTY